MGNEYQTYLQSEAWYSKRLQKLNESGRQCAACGTGKRLQVHHLTYEHIFEEPMEDLMTLCDFHHRAAENFIARGLLSRVGNVREIAARTLSLLRKRKRKHRLTAERIIFTEALRKADTQSSPNIGTYPEHVQRLLRVCSVLQKSAGDFSFFISVRQAAEVLGLEDKLFTANAILAKLASDGVLRLTKRGTRHKASEYRMTL